MTSEAIISRLENLDRSDELCLNGEAIALLLRNWKCFLSDTENGYELVTPVNSEEILSYLDMKASSIHRFTTSNKETFFSLWVRLASWPDAKFRLNSVLDTDYIGEESAVLELGDNAFVEISYDPRPP
ncbi:MAG: hypothetical protein V3T31_04600, partial [candidate division Zixibacteria bacterium]